MQGKNITPITKVTILLGMKGKESMIDAEYTLTEDDFLTFHRYTIASVPGIRWRYRLFRWGYPIALMLNGIWLTVRMPHDVADKIYGIGFIGVAALLLIGR